MITQKLKVRQVPITVQKGPKISEPDSSGSDEDILTVTNTKKARNVVEIEEIEEEEHESISQESGVSDKDTQSQEKLVQSDTSTSQKTDSQTKKVTHQHFFFSL